MLAISAGYLLCIVSCTPPSPRHPQLFLAIFTIAIIEMVTWVLALLPQSCRGHPYSLNGRTIATRSFHLSQWAFDRAAAPKVKLTEITFSHTKHKKTHWTQKEESKRI